MCTVSWYITPDGFELLSNRDELRTRQPALPPEVVGGAHGSAIYPRDGDCGGTWVGVNAAGIALCLLNRYDVPLPDPPPGGWASRGDLIPALLEHQTLAALQAALQRPLWASMRPFTLLILAPGASAMLLAWDGARAALEPARAPLISSSLDQRQAHTCRVAAWEDLAGPSGAALLAFHRAHAPDRGPFSPCMHRADAHTVSFTWVRVAADQVGLGYFPAAPCHLPAPPAADPFFSLRPLTLGRTPSIPG